MSALIFFHKLDNRPARGDEDGERAHPPGLGSFARDLRAVGAGEFRQFPSVRHFAMTHEDQRVRLPRQQAAQFIAGARHRHGFESERRIWKANGLPHASPGQRPG